MNFLSNCAAVIYVAAMGVGICVQYWWERRWFRPYPLPEDDE